MEIGKNTTFAVLIIALLAIGSYLYVNAPNSQETITVQGVSQLTSSPDLAVIYLSIETLDKSAQISESENSEITEKVMDSLRNLGFSDDEIETISYNLGEDYTYTQNGAVSNGYKTTHYIKVSMDEFKVIGTVIDRVVIDGALVNSLQFELEKEHEQELKAEALESATGDAKTKAEAIARGSGGKLGKLVSITTNDYYYLPYVAYEARAGSATDASAVKEAATQISTSNIQINAQVNAVYSFR